jgi:penicillin-binding protein 2
VANGGVLYTPHVARAINNELVLPEGEALPDNLREALKTVRQGMRQTVISGSARRLNTLPITSAGKTGTAQIGGTENTHAWYTGFAPYENPEIAVVVMIEEGGEGSSTAVVVAEDIFKWWYNNRREKD